MKKFLSVLIASAFAASASMPVYAADTATAPAAAKSADTTDAAKTKKPRRHWCKTTQQFQTAPCPKKGKKAPEAGKDAASAPAASDKK